jgi:ribosomal-protein-alanine N-acetyltransferase
MMSLDNDQITIRPMQVDDLGQVLAIDQASFNLPWPESAFRYELFENSASRLWVAEIEQLGKIKRVVGCVVVWLILDEAHIATIAVDPEYRQQGIGSKLLFVALNKARCEGARSALLEVRAGNIQAQSLYVHFGFCIVGKRSRYYKDNHEDAVLMTAPDLEKLSEQWLEQGILKSPAREI